MADVSTYPMNWTTVPFVARASCQVSRLAYAIQRGTYQNGARTYDPTKGTFLTPDTYGPGTTKQNQGIGTDPLTANTYTYVNGDPVNLNDPTGHAPLCQCAPFISPAQLWQYNAAMNTRELGSGLDPRCAGEYLAVAACPARTAAGRRRQTLVRNELRALVAGFLTRIVRDQDANAAMEAQQQQEEQQYLVQSCIRINAESAGKVVISLDASRSGTGAVKCEFGNLPTPPLAQRFVNALSGVSSYISMASGDIALVCTATLQPECAGPAAAISKGAALVSVASSLEVSVYICTHTSWSSTSCAGSFLFTGVQGVATGFDLKLPAASASRIAASNIGPFIGIPSSLSNSSALQSIADQSARPSEGQIVCLNERGRNLCHGALG